MKKLFAGLVALAVVALAMPAEASWNVRQKGNGSRVLTDGAVEVPDSGSVIVVPISSFAQTLTHFTLTNSPGKVKKVYAINHLPFAAQSGAPTVTLTYSAGTTAAFTPISVGSTLTMTTALFAGRVSSLSFNEASTSLSQGYAIGVAVSATSVTAVSGSVVIVLE